MVFCAAGLYIHMETTVAIAVLKTVKIASFLLQNRGFDVVWDKDMKLSSTIYLFMIPQLPTKLISGTKFIHLLLLSISNSCDTICPSSRLVVDESFASWISREGWCSLD